MRPGEDGALFFQEVWYICRSRSRTIPLVGIQENHDVSSQQIFAHAKAVRTFEEFPQLFRADLCRFKNYWTGKVFALSVHRLLTPRIADQMFRFEIFGGKIACNEVLMLM